MSRPYMCKKCGVSHNPPTGKKCKQDYSQDKDNDIAILAESVQQMAKSLASVTTRLDSMERETEESSVERDATSDMSDTEGATAKSLRSDSNLQKHVKSRMAALKLLDKEDTDSDTDGDDIDKQSKSVKPRNIRKSGRNRTADDVISKEIDWPHYHCYRGPDRLPARYEELSIPEFVQGYLTTALDGKQNAQTREKMLRHLQELMRDASDHRWEHVRNYHAILLHQYEMERITWDSTGEIQKLRATYVFNARHAATSEKTAHTRYCASYQRGGCSHQGDHTSPRGYVRHICAYCVTKNRGNYNHPENECRMKQRSQTAQPEGRDQAKNDKQL